MTTFGDMVYQFGGMPVGGMRFTTPWANHYFVDGDEGVDVGAGVWGKRPDEAFKTIQKACTVALAQDVIYVRPKSYTLGTGFARYTEDVVVALGGVGGSGATATRANISLIGVTPKNLSAIDFLGVRWKFLTATSLTVDPPGMHVENIGFFTEDATYAIHLRNNGATRTREGTSGFSIYNCAIKGQGKLYGEGANELVIANCRFQCKYDGAVGGINLVGSTNQVVRPIIKNCEFIGGNANNMDGPCIVGAAPWYDALIRDCYFLAESDTGVYISITGTNTGMVANCYFGSADIQTTSIVASGMLGVGCYDDDGIQAAPIA